MMNYLPLAPRPNDISGTELAVLQQREGARCSEIVRKVRAGEPPVFSHVTALRLLGIEVPKMAAEVRGGSALCWEAVHTCTAERRTRTDMKNVRSHLWSRPLRPVLVDGRFRCVDPLVAWEQMAEWLTLDELVVLGDAMMRRQRNFIPDGVRGFERILEADRHFRGRKACLKALPLLRCGTDSSQETRLRLLMEKHGLTGAVVNMKTLDPLSGKVSYFDIAYPQHGFALEYHGRQHGLHETWTRDIDKVRFLFRQNMYVFGVKADDMTNERKMNELLATIFTQISVPRLVGE